LVEWLGPLSEKQFREALQELLQGPNLKTLSDLYEMTRQVRDTIAGSIFVELATVDIRGTIDVGSLIGGSVGVTNFPADYPDAKAQEWLGSVFNRLQDIKGSVDITNLPTDYPDSEAQAWLSSVHARLKEIAGTVIVDNFPTDYPDSQAHGWLGSLFDRLYDVKGTQYVENMPSDFPDASAHDWLSSVYNRLRDIAGTVDVGNLPTDYPDAVSQGWLGSIFDRIMKIASTPAHGTVYVGTVSTLIVAADADRLDLAIFNEGPGTLYIGASGVGTLDGFPIDVSEKVVMTLRGDLYGAADVADTKVRYFTLSL